MDSVNIRGKVNKVNKVGKKMSGGGNKENNCGKTVTKEERHLGKFVSYRSPKLRPRDYSLGGLNRMEIQSHVA